MVVLIGFEKFLYKGNGEVSKELLSNCFQKPCSCFSYRLSYNHPNGVIPIVKEPYELELQIYIWDHKKIVALRFPNMGLKVSFGYLTGMLCFGCSCGVLAIS